MKSPSIGVLSTLAVAALILAAPLRAGTFDADFNDGQVPAGSQVFGNAMVESGGGVGDTACLKLTKNANSQSGSIVIEDLDGYANVYGIRATFMARVGGGTSVPADGWSFCVGDLPDGTWSETGIGSGVRVCFDTYDNTDGDPNNGTGEAPQIRLVIGGATVATTPLLPLSDLINSEFVPVEILLDADGSFSLTYNAKVHFPKFFFPGYQPLSGARIGFGARTGGLNAHHWIDDLSVRSKTRTVFCGVCLTLLGSLTMGQSSFVRQSQPAMAGSRLEFAADDIAGCITREFCLPSRCEALFSHYETRSMPFAAPPGPVPAIPRSHHA